MQKLNFYLGEQRHVRMRIHAANNEPFTIREASYELKQCGTVEDSGTCTIDGETLDAFIAPKSRTAYKLYFTYKVADETLVECVEVVVE